MKPSRKRRKLLQVLRRKPHKVSGRGLKKLLTKKRLMSRQELRNGARN
jgi:hypothetical protein